MALPSRELQTTILRRYGWRAVCPCGHPFPYRAARAEAVDDLREHTHDGDRKRRK